MYTCGGFILIFGKTDTNIKKFKKKKKKKKRTSSFQENRSPNKDCKDRPKGLGASYLLF